MPVRCALTGAAAAAAASAASGSSAAASAASSAAGGERASPLRVLLCQCRRSCDLLPCSPHHPVSTKPPPFAQVTLWCRRFLPVTRFPCVLPPRQALPRRLPQQVLPPPRQLQLRQPQVPQPPQVGFSCSLSASGSPCHYEPQVAVAAVRSDYLMHQDECLHLFSVDPNTPGWPRCDNSRKRKEKKRKGYAVGHFITRLSALRDAQGTCLDPICYEK